MDRSSFARAASLTALLLSLAAVVVAETPKPDSAAASPSTLRPTVHEFEGDPMPETLHSQDRGPETPYWVRADRVFLEDGSWNYKLLGLYGSDLEFRWSASDAETCVPAIDRCNTGLARPSFARLVATTDWIFWGRVTGIADGVADGRLRTLYRVLPIEVLKGPSWHWEHYLDQSTPQLTLKGRLLCEDRSNFPDPPELGQEVLVFAPLYLSDGGVFQDVERRSFLTGAGPRSLFPVEEDGTMRLPADFRKVARAPWPSTRHELTAWLLEQIAKPETGEAPQ